MAKKRASKRQGKSVKKSTKRAKKKAGSRARRGVVALTSNKHEKMRIGMTAKGSTPLIFKADGTTPNTFRVYGDSIGTRPVSDKDVVLTSTRFDWNPPTEIHNRGANALEITAKCLPKPLPPGTRFVTTDDDLTVTIIYDDELNPPDTTDDTFDEVEYEP